MPIYRDKKRGCFVFEFDRRIEGKRVRARKALPKNWNRAKADAFDREESARLYGRITGVEKPSFSIEQAVEVYCKERLPHLKTGRQIAQDLALIYWAYQDRPMTDLPDVCKEIVKDAADRLAPATVRNRIRYLTSACRYGYKHHAMAESDPAERVIVPEVRNERRVFISRREMLRLARACPHRPTRAAIRIAFYSGMRMSEILLAERVDGNFVLADTKNGEPRIIPIHPRIRGCAGISLPNQSCISKHFRRARAAAGMDELHFHDLRHSAASEMINNGVDLYTVGAVLGHKSSQSTKRYAHLATRSLRAAIGKIGQKIPHQKKKRAA